MQELLGVTTDDILIEEQVILDPEKYWLYLILVYYMSFYW